MIRPTTGWVNPPPCDSVYLHLQPCLSKASGISIRPLDAAGTIKSYRLQNLCTRGHALCCCVLTCVHHVTLEGNSCSLQYSLHGVVQGRVQE